jgi:hypothetical protein
LWDWLHLLLLPIAVGVLPIWLSRRTRLTSRHKSLALTILSGFALVVLIGYTVPWGWTGFRGNTLWDWLHLLLLPLLLPTIVVPAVMPKATAGLIIVDGDDSRTAEPDPDSSNGETDSAQPASTAAADPETGRPCPLAGRSHD